MLSCILGDGVLNFLEFIDLMVNDKEEIEELIEAFRAFDTEDTGTDPNFPTCICCPSEQSWFPQGTGTDRKVSFVLWALGRNEWLWQKGNIPVRFCPEESFSKWKPAFTMIRALSTKENAIWDMLDFAHDLQQNNAFVFAYLLPFDSNVIEWMVSKKVADLVSLNLLYIIIYYYILLYRYTCLHGKVRLYRCIGSPVWT